LACHSRIAAPSAVFGHRGAALGLLTGWGGTQRLPRLIGKAKAVEIFISADKIDASTALRIGLVDAVVQDPVAKALHCARVWLDQGQQNVDLNRAWPFARLRSAGIP
jgi:enoyl-CoA hydratase